MSPAELINKFSWINEFSEYDTNMPKKDIKLKYLQCTRHLMCWHDDATLACHGYILMTFSELYNPTIHYCDNEFVAKFRKDIHVQQLTSNFYICPSGVLTSLNWKKDYQHKMD